MDKWYNAKTEPPKRNGKYLCAMKQLTHQSHDICYWANCLRDVDEYDFKGIKCGGWYWYDSEYGYYEVNDVAYWMPLPELPEE